jgi:hypothetical protein
MGGESETLRRHSRILRDKGQGFLLLRHARLQGPPRPVHPVHGADATHCNSYYHVSHQGPGLPVTSPGNGNFATQYNIHTQQLALGLTTSLSNSLSE